MGKSPIDDLIDHDQVMARLAEMFGVEATLKALADELGISAQAFRDPKQRNGLLGVIMRWTIRHGESPD